MESTNTADNRFVKDTEIEEEAMRGLAWVQGKRMEGEIMAALVCFSMEQLHPEGAYFIVICSNLDQFNLHSISEYTLFCMSQVEIQLSDTIVEKIIKSEFYNLIAIQLKLPIAASWLRKRKFYCNIE